MKKNPKTFLGRELSLTIQNLDAVLDVKQPWGRIIDDVRQNFAWDFEEATAIECSKNREQVYIEVRNFLETHFGIEYTEEIAELFRYQMLGLIDPKETYPLQSTFKHNIHNVIHRKASPQRVDTTVSFDAENYTCTRR